MTAWEHTGTFCACGCGELTALAAYTDKRSGSIKGQPNKYLLGHNPRVRPEERFWEKVDVGHPLGCWEWTGCRNYDGYGQFSVDRRLTSSHRFAYELLMGPIPEGLHLDHLCRNPPCVNPDHLEPVTAAENTRRGFLPNKTYCNHGHRWTPQTTYRTPQGFRQCRVCRQDRKRRLRQAQKAVSS